ncbi:MAG: hypothetical protein Q9217_004292 [Psora testacea]
MTEFAELALEGVPIVTENYDKVYDPVKNKTKQGVNKVKKLRNNRGKAEEEDDFTEYEYDGPPRRAYTDQRRSPSHRRSRRGDLIEERHIIQTSNGRAKSVGRDGYGSTSVGRGDRRGGSRRDYSDSEASLPPPRRNGRRPSLGEKALAALGLGGATAAADKSRRRSYSRSRSRSRDRSRRRRRSPSPDYDGHRSNRSLGPPSSRGYYDRGYYDDLTPPRYKPAGYINNRNRDSERGSPPNQVARRDNRSDVARKDKQKGSSSSSDSSSDVCSSSEDERRTRKVKGKEYITAGLAAVATIHAAHGVYSSMEARDKRHLEMLKGEISPEEARKAKHKARLQDAAAIGIAALGIKGAYSEWQEVQESRQEMLKLKKERAERHEKRMKKAEKLARERGRHGSH